MSNPYPEYKRNTITVPAPVQQEPVAAIQEVIGCFNAALAEGLQEALANTTDERLKDLVERRLMHAFYAASLLNDPIAAIRARSNT